MANPEVNNTLVLSTETQSYFSIHFLIIAEIKLCDQQKLCSQLHNLKPQYKWQKEKSKSWL